jgi:hypothetical protein
VTLGWLRPRQGTTTVSFLPPCAARYDRTGLELSVADNKPRIALSEQNRRPRLELARDSGGGPDGNCDGSELGFDVQHCGSPHLLMDR